RKPDSLFSTFLLTLVTFHLVLYSTFLTRSGVLGDTSVHSFTGDGMMPGLTVFMMFFIWLATLFLHPERLQRTTYTLAAAALFLVGTLFAQPVAAIVLFLVLSAVWTFSAYRSGHAKNTEEEGLWSREFWMFIGALVLLLSAAQVTFSTSVPVFNLLLGPFKQPLQGIGNTWGWDWLITLSKAEMAPPGEPVAHYNKWQIPFAFIVSILVAFVQYLRYKSTDMRKFRKQIAGSLVVSIVITALAVVLLRYTLSELDLIALFFATCFAAVANGAYIWKGLKAKWSLAGPSVAHIGFGLVLMGALVSTSRQQEMSRNSEGMDLRYLAEGLSNNTDVLLYRGDTVLMGEFYVHYKDKRKSGVDLKYAMEYFAPEPRRYGAGDTVRVGSMLFSAKNDHLAGEAFLSDQPDHWAPLEDYPRRAVWNATPWRNNRPGKALFTLEPFVQINPRFGNVAEPSTKHWPHKDLYTHVRYADLEEDAAADTSAVHYMPPRTYEKQVGDTIVTPTSLIILDSLRMVQDSVTRSMLGPEFTVYALSTRVRDLYVPDRWFEAKPVVIYRDGLPVAGKGAEIHALRSKIELSRVEGRDLEVRILEHEFVVMQAIVFPGINILWIGCVLMFIGTFMAVRRRIVPARRS
ncbi:MAG: hypothetical protein KDB88_08715, partial [Flavobacteriales bacterium]|nr:hypothetical protein [Flavobacteriales bacterium]